MAVPVIDHHAPNQRMMKLFFIPRTKEELLILSIQKILIRGTAKPLIRMGKQGAIKLQVHARQKDSPLNMGLH